jgi:4-amino-4-deoxychorismate lyase
MNMIEGTRIFLGDAPVDSIPENDRGLAYGDGLFETMRVHGSRVPWWDVHWARLAHGAERLRLLLPDRGLVEQQVEALLASQGMGAGSVLKLLLTRGSDGRGYLPPADNVPLWILSQHPVPSPPRAGGLHLRWCATQLALQPALAGLKHCNRLEQVLARGEWNDPDIDEGLLQDMDGNVVSATAANVFVLRDGGWRTPSVDRCGVAGVCRGWLLAASGAMEMRLAVDDIDTADAVVLCNAVRGILPVARLGDRAWMPHPEVRALRRRLAAAHPAFIVPEDNA